jgi:AAA domain-containing protein
MQLVFIYGPPGVGKLSVGRELAALTGFGLFHNHLTLDLAVVLYPFGSEPFRRLVRRYRLEFIAEAVQANVDLVYTFVYNKPDDDAFMAELLEPVRASGGHVRFVRLTCARAVLLARVEDASRRARGKLVDPAVVAELLDKRNMEATVPGGDSLSIDTTHLAPDEAAVRIAQHYALLRL